MNERSNEARSERLGILAAVVTWLASALSVPLVKVLTGFSPEQLLTWRSLMVMIAAYVAARGRIWGFNKHTLIACPVLALSSLSFYHALRIWDFYPVMVVLTVSPLVNVGIAWYEGRRPSKDVIIGLVLVISGIAIGMQFWKQSINVYGLIWALTAAITGGVINDLWHRSGKTATAACNAFWSCGCLFVIAGIMSCYQGAISWGSHGLVVGLMGLVWFGLVGGVCYFGASVHLFKLLPPERSSILAQGVTPAVILGGCLFEGKAISAIQLIGMIMAIIGISVVLVWLARDAQQKSKL
jgi:drug/metabolite transporter (DMT)-like permease